VEDLLAIENQTELILEDPSPEVLARISALLDGSGTRVVAQRQRRTTLEELFLEATKPAAEQ
jgi:ABC-2 type transport system ATP-binding protein